MADGVNLEPEIRLHQALHGYADGHCQLALSASLKPRDQKRLLALSDISGPGACLEDDGYLTGYPLLESGFFALGRTWPAPEMPRPGCVWTHTLLIRLTDLAALNTLTGLLAMFRRPPGIRAAPGYAEPTIFSTNVPICFTPFTEDWARRVIAGLYGQPRRRIVATGYGGVDSVVLALWSQQWPRLRRSFSFCTLATRDRSDQNGSFDLQIFPDSDRSIRTRFTGALDADSAAFGAGRWVDDAIDDLVQPNGTRLRDLFRRLGADIRVGREAFRPLCLLHRALPASHTPAETVNEAITILSHEFGPDPSRAARTTVAKAAFDHVEKLDEPSFRFLWANLSLLDPDILLTGALPLGRAAWRRDPSLLIPLLTEESTRGVVDRTLANLDLPELVTGLAQAPALRAAALTRRPEVLAQPAFWTNLDNVGPAFRAAKGWKVEVTLSALMLAGRHDLAADAVHEFGYAATLRALNAVWERSPAEVGAWLQPSTRDVGAVAEFLVAESTIPGLMVYRLARGLAPEAVPNDYGEDPWLIAQRHAVGEIDDTEATYLNAYLLSRAFTQRTRCAGELAQLSFESTHAALASNRLAYGDWRLLETRLPWSTTWWEWDRCFRLRAGVVALFVDRDLAPGLFAELCENDRLFALLSERAARVKRGRGYLKRVRRFLRNAPNEQMSARSSIINGVLS